MSELDDVVIDIAGTPVEFNILERDAAWLAQGTWRERAVQLHADHIAPDRLQLQTVRLIPNGVRQAPTARRRRDVVAILDPAFV